MSAKRAGKLSELGKEFVNINSADEDELQRLPDVGPAMAARIAHQQRKENGPFSDEEQLQDNSCS